MLTAATALLLAASTVGAASAQVAPTLDQVYQAAHAGHLTEAQQMMQSVLRDHPNSAKAHYVEAELLAGQGQLTGAREQLATAEHLAPGLSFAHADAVQRLRSQLAGVPLRGASLGASQKSESHPFNMSYSSDASRMGGSSDHTGISGIGDHGTGAPWSFPWGVMVALLGGAGVAWLLMRMSRPSGTTTPTGMAPYGFSSATPSPTTGLALGTGAGTGTGPGMGMGMGMGGSAPSAGLGSQVTGGLATGLAVGAGVMAAESIGRHLFSHDAAPWDTQRLQPMAPKADLRPAEPDLGGADFGIDNATSWDDGSGNGGGDGGGGSDGGWDN